MVFPRVELNGTLLAPQLMKNGYGAFQFLLTGARHVIPCERDKKETLEPDSERNR